MLGLEPLAATDFRPVWNGGVVLQVETFLRRHDADLRVARELGAAGPYREGATMSAPVSAVAELSGLVYSGEHGDRAVVRRIDFDAAHLAPRLRWEHRMREGARLGDHTYGRAGDLVLYPSQGGLTGACVFTGQWRWTVAGARSNGPEGGVEPPSRELGVAPDGTVLAAFGDHWLRIEPATGRVLDSDGEQVFVARRATRLTEPAPPATQLAIGGRRVAVSMGAVDFSELRQWDRFRGPEIDALEVPPLGRRAIAGFQAVAEGGLAVVAARLAVWLRRDSGERSAGAAGSALGLIELTSGEVAHVVELGSEPMRLEALHALDDVLVARTRPFESPEPTPATTWLIDPARGRLLARLCDGRGVLYGAGAAPVWQGAL